MTTIAVEKRNPQWKANHLRRNNYVPGGVYGGPLPEAISLQIPELAARQIVRTLAEGDALTLELEGKAYPVILKAKTVSILNDAIEQLSFQALTEA